MSQTPENEQENIKQINEMICEQKEVADLDKLNQIIKQCINKRKANLLATGQESGGDFQLSVRLFLHIIHEMEVDFVSLLSTEGKDLFKPPADTPQDDGELIGYEEVRSDEVSNMGKSLLLQEL